MLIFLNFETKNLENIHELHICPALKWYLRGGAHGRPGSGHMIKFPGASLFCSSKTTQKVPNLQRAAILCLESSGDYDKHECRLHGKIIALKNHNNVY